MAKRRKKRTATKRKKQNLAGMDFDSLVNMRNQVDEALTGYRSTLEKQLAALGGSSRRSVARLCVVCAEAQ